MVYEPGGYNFMDYIKFGVPLQIVCAIFTVAIVFSLDQWWAYAVVFAFLSPAVVILYFFLGGDKANVRENPILAGKDAALEEGHASHSVDASAKAAAPSPELAQNIALLPIRNDAASDPNAVSPIAGGNGVDLTPPAGDHPSTSGALIFTGTA
jgi:hypothetical protein